MTATADALTELTRARQYAGDAIADVEFHAAVLGRAIAHEQQLEDERPLVKRAAILRIMQTPNDLTGKPHSASSAADYVELDAEYLAHRARQRDAVVATHEARGRWEAAKRTADMAVETFKLVGEV
jgi:hypothetical protein